MKTLKYILIALGAVLVLGSCEKSDVNYRAPEAPKYNDGAFAMGADVGWVTEMEAAGLKFYDRNGLQTECIALMKNLGMNSIRLRTWVNPADGWGGTEDLLIKAWRAKNLGMRIMIDFHYSDEWADPAKQFKPKAWLGQDLDELTVTLADYTTDVLNQLKAIGVTPEWVQVGNENPSGMLWNNDGSMENSGHINANGGENFTKLFMSGYNAVKGVFPDAKVVVHIDNGHDLARSKKVLDRIKKFGGKWDVLGLSLYPVAANWETRNAACLATMQHVVDNYGTEVMLCEVGMPWDEPEVSKLFLADIIAKTQSVKSSDGKQMGTGVFYWEPQAYNWKSYEKGAFDENGVPTVAMDAFAAK